MTEPSLSKALNHLTAAAERLQSGQQRQRQRQQHRDWLYWAAPRCEHGTEWINVCDKEKVWAVRQVQQKLRHKKNILRSHCCERVFFFKLSRHEIMFHELWRRKWHTRECQCMNGYKSVSAFCTVEKWADFHRFCHNYCLLFIFNMKMFWCMALQFPSCFGWSVMLLWSPN